MTQKLSWNDRFALIDAYKPSDDAICSAFSVSSDELATARELRSSGTFTANEKFNVADYSDVFTISASKSVNRKEPSVDNKARTSSVTKIKKLDNTSPGKAESATKKTVLPKKRGRKGDKIVKAFAAIPTTPVSVEDFAKDHNVSVAVLRQNKRFDKSPELGAIQVKKDKESKRLMIWRDKQ